MTSEINDQACTIQTLVLPSGVGIASNSSSSLTPILGSLATDVSKPGSIFIGNGSSWGNTTFGLLYGNSFAPTITAGSGAGTGSTITIIGNDLIGQIAITVGTSPAVGISTIISMTMTKTSTIRPVPIITFTGTLNPLASLPVVGTASVSNNTWVIRNYGTGALSTGETYFWNYFVPSL